MKAIRICGLFTLLIVLSVACGGGNSTERSTSIPVANQSQPSFSNSPTPSSSSSPTERSYGQRPSPPALPVNAEDQRRTIEQFFRSLESVCADYSKGIGQEPMESIHFAESRVIREQAPGKWLLEDGKGNMLVMDVTGWSEEDVTGSVGRAVRPAEGAWVVTGTEGPDGPLMRPYSTFCPEDVFVGRFQE
jgi:hypothetical protein